MHRSLLTFRQACLLAGLVLLSTAAGCQSFRLPATGGLPWSSTAGLPSQWEPDVQTAGQ